MRRALYLLTFILVIAVGAMMLWQWKVFSKEREQLEGEQTATEQLIHIEQTNKRLSVMQTFSGLNAGTYKIGNPMQIAYTIEGRDEMAPASVKVDEGESEITFVYDIPFEGNEISRLLTGWAVELENTETVKTRVEIMVAEDRRAGSWAAGAPLIGKAKKEHIDYYMFENEGPVYPLYYQTGQLLFAKIAGATGLYYEEGARVDEIETVLAESSLLENQFAILTSKHNSFESQNLYLLDNRQSIEQLKNRIANMNIDAAFPFEEDEERWQQHVLHSLANEMESGSEKAKQMTRILKEGLLESEAASFIQSVKIVEQPLAAVVLDEVLSGALNKETAFFSLNSVETAELVPLFYYDERKLALNGTEIEQPIVYFENRRLVPFFPMISYAGFQYESIDTGEILLTRSGDTLRMYPGENVFIFNGTDYSVKSSPVIMLANELYIYENWLRDIFGVKLTEQQGYLTAK